jgi:hypothetical protein
VTDVTERIKNYLGSGGLFNPELMEHEKVRDLLMDCRNEIGILRHKLVAQKVLIKHAHDEGRQ